MKQVFSTAAVAGVTSALSLREMFNKTVLGETYRFREGTAPSDGSNTKVIYSTNQDNTGYVPTTALKEWEWKINCHTIVNEDTGDTILIMTHKLKA